MNDTINGYAIIAAWPLSDGRIIVVDRTSAHEERFVVAVQYGGEEQWAGACYCLDFDEARRAFVRRVEEA